MTAQDERQGETVIPNDDEPGEAQDLTKETDDDTGLTCAATSDACKAKKTKTGISLTTEEELNSANSLS